jgi:hypothetical protein
MNMKLIAGAFLVGGLCAGTWYYQDEISLALMTNDHQQAAYQFWYKEANAVTQNKAHHLPIKKSIVLNDISYNLGTITEQDGKFFFDTTVSFNNRSPIALYTVVESVQGVWKVNLTETFLTTNTAALKRSTNLYSTYMNNANNFIDMGVKVDFEAASMTPEQHKEIDAWIDSLFIESKATLKAQYISNL